MAARVSQTWQTDIRRSMFIMIGVASLMGAAFALVKPSVYNSAPIQAVASEASLVIESGKVYSSIISMMTTLSTGLFVIVALVVKNPLQAAKTASAGQFILLGLFGLGACSSYFLALHAQYAVADGILAKSLDLDYLGTTIGLQGMAVALAGAAALSLVAESIINPKV